MWIRLGWKIDENSFQIWNLIKLPDFMLINILMSLKFLSSFIEDFDKAMKRRMLVYSCCRPTDDFGSFHLHYVWLRNIAQETRQYTIEATISE